MMTYAKASAQLARSRNKNDCPLSGKATRLVRIASNAIAIRYHATDVVTLTEDGQYILHTGGWRTATTKARITEYAPVTISSVRGTWTVTSPFRAAFFDGMTVTSTGDILNRDPEADTRAEAVKAIDAAIRAYIRGFVAECASGSIANPDGGDCWLCSMFGEHDGTDHILSHIGIGQDAETYFVPSLLWTAILERNNGNAERTRDHFQMRQAFPFIVRSALRAFFARRRESLITAVMQIAV